MANRHQQKLEKESSEHGSQISRNKQRIPVNVYIQIFILYDLIIFPSNIIDVH